MNIIDFVDGPTAEWFKDKATWARWRVMLKAAFLPGSDFDAEELTILKEHAGLDAPPAERPREIWLKCGRRSGKSLIISVIAAWLAAFADFSRYLVPGEAGVILIVAVDRKGAAVCMKYLAAMFERVPLLQQLLAGPSTADTIYLRNGLEIEIGTNSARSIRGRTVVAALCDEIAHWRDEEHFVNPAGEVIDGAIRPAMASIPNAVLLASSTPFLRRGMQFATFQECWGKVCDTMCWHGRSLVMNPTLSAALVERARRKDAAKAAAEYDAIEREDLEAFISPEAVEKCVAPGRLEIAPQPKIIYHGFVDCAGGSGGDSMTAAVAFVDGARVIVAAVRERRPRFSPDDASAEFAAFFKSYGIHRVRGDRYAGDFPVDRFKAGGVELVAAEQTKSELYLEIVPEINAGTVELLDHPRTNDQLCQLVRTPGRNNRDAVDHPKSIGHHDDLINAVAGAVVEARRCARRPKIPTVGWVHTVPNPDALMSTSTKRDLDLPFWRRG